MEAGPSPGRLLTCAAALAALAALTSGCGGGADAQAVVAKKNDPPPVRYSSPSLSFTYPAGWTASHPKGPGELHFQPLIYLSSQPVGSPCSVHGNVTTCGWPVKRLGPGGVVALWQVPYSPLRPSGTPKGTRISVGGSDAWRNERTAESCRAIGGDRTIDVSIPAHSLALAVCLRGPNLAQNERRLGALLASVEFPSH
jgi:hypothetical protein